MLTTNTTTQSFHGTSHTAAGRTVAITHAIELPGFTMGFDRDEEIFGEGESADFIYRVVKGAVRVTRLLDDGRRLISAFYLPGDVFGLEMGDAHGATAEAIVDSEIGLVKRAVIDRVAGQDRATIDALWSLTARELRNAQDHLLMLGRRSAAEKVGLFLVDVAQRSASGNEIHLPMSRLDIADFLGLTIETVSRTMTQLERDGVIAMQGCRQIRLLDMSALERA